MNVNLDENGKVTFRRLLLSKELYLHGLEHSKSRSSLDKMVAIHNFHNALEIALRAILLSYEIRMDKQLNIDFESMLNEIDSFPEFKRKKIRLPYRQELRNLNQLRNMVQHHAMEPESSTMDDWRVFTRRFLTKTFEAYFNLLFDEISSVQFIEDESLKNLILLGHKFRQSGDLVNALISAKLAFIFASYSFRNIMDEDVFNNDFFVIADIRSTILNQINQEVSSKIEDIIKKIYEKIDESSLYSIITSSGVSFVDYKSFESSTPHIDLTLDGGYVVQTGSDFTPDYETTLWVLNFVEQTLIKWQLSGINLKLRNELKDSCCSALSGMNNKLK